MNKEKYLVSACLLGKNCKYNGGNNYCEKVVTFLKDKEVYMICPEEMGGLPTPRIPCEIAGTKVLNKQGEDKTEAFYKGAQKTLDIAKEKGVNKAILKAKSPSCGKGHVYDGTFTNTLICGNGITANLLEENGIKIYNEAEIEELKS